MVSLQPGRALLLAPGHMATTQERTRRVILGQAEGASSDLRTASECICLFERKALESQFDFLF